MFSVKKLTAAILLASMAGTAIAEQTREGDLDKGLMAISKTLNDGLDALGPPPDEGPWTEYNKRRSPILNRFYRQKDALLKAYEAADHPAMTANKESDHDRINNRPPNQKKGWIYKYKATKVERIE
ncbi:hypothetical protein [Solemya elarraichensis gill symbiont]|uniref:Uncharacterized protein n=1 Tax=Solemya elarraichensis gill symbiont TaxID=1918949 RepID=A0A1T2KYV4_9GAMM|nr:hypothetical protein [Solemya elarraichensis gill symbiont]OOZ38048.1 hypothetical protein BOW52_09505 [Solemya elarraichensis gill symbiont]